jgi:hypothetical protein
METQEIIRSCLRTSINREKLVKILTKHIKKLEKIENTIAEIKPPHWSCPPVVTTTTVDSNVNSSNNTVIGTINSTTTAVDGIDANTSDHAKQVANRYNLTRDMDGVGLIDTNGFVFDPVWAEVIGKKTDAATLGALTDADVQQAKSLGYALPPIFITPENGGDTGYDIATEVVTFNITKDQYVAFYRLKQSRMVDMDDFQKVSHFTKLSVPMVEHIFINQKGLHDRYIQYVR